MDREILFRMSEKELKPCPFCGRKWCFTEMSILINTAKRL